MKNEQIQWGTAAVFICTKCGKSIPGAPADLGEQLKAEFKTEMNKLGLGKEVRVMTSSCLDICESGMQAVAFIPKGDASQAIVKVFDPLTEKEDFRQALLALKK